MGGTALPIQSKAFVLWMLLGSSAAMHIPLTLVSHLDSTDVDALRIKFSNITENPGDFPLQDIFFARSGLESLGFEPLCDCDGFKAIKKGHILTGIDLFYRNTMISSCGCMESVVVDSIRQRFNEDGEDDIPSASELFGEPEVEDSMVGICAWLLSDGAQMAPQSYGAAVLKLSSSLLTNSGSADVSDAGLVADVLFALSMRDKRWKRSDNKISALVNAIGAALLPQRSPVDVGTNAYFYRLLSAAAPAGSLEAKWGADALVSALFDIVRYSDVVREQAEAVASLAHIAALAREQYYAVPLHYTPRERSLSGYSTVPEIVIEAYDWRGKAQTPFESVTIESLSTFTSGSGSASREVALSSRRASVSVLDGVAVPLPVLSKGSYALRLNCTFAAIGDQPVMSVSPVVYFTVSPVVELGSIRIGKTSSADPKTADLLLLHREKSALGPGDIKFMVYNNMSSDSNAKLLHIRLGLIAAQASQPDHVFLSVSYAQPTAVVCKPILLAMATNRAKGSKQNEYIYDLSVSVMKLFNDFPKSFPHAGDYELKLHIMDATLSEPKIVSLGTVAIDWKDAENVAEITQSLYDTPLLDQSDRTFVALPEIRHKFRPPVVRADQVLWAPAAATAVFALAAFVITSLVSVAGSKFRRVSGFEPVLLFGSVVSMTVLYGLCWFGFSDFGFYASLKYLGLCSVLVIVAGYRLCVVEAACSDFMQENIPREAVQSADALLTPSKKVD